jgi:DNA-binding NarL/FixJ family response regulator
MLGASADFKLCGEAASGAEALELIPKLKPDLVLMDVHMAGFDGPDVTRRVLESHPGLKIVAWTVSDSSDDLLRMIQAGCIGYVLKDVGPEELHRALGAAIKDENPVPRKMIPAVLRRLAPQAQSPKAAQISLSSRELQVLRGLARGFTTKRLSADFGLAINSVESYQKTLYRKLHVSSRGEAVSAAMKLGLISLSDL